jgi:acyl-CoA reductase-like NAD-dependent aldehyde dehydrogenase
VSHDHHDLFIDGRLTPAHSEAVLTTINPATEEPVGSAPDGGADDIDAAIQAARAAFRESGWPQLAPKERARYLRALADEFEKRNDELGALVTMENGMALSVCGAFNGIGSATRYRYYAGLAESWDPEEVRDYPEASSGPAKIKTIVRRQPAGVVGIIVPWNVPQGNVAVKLGAALAAGCTAVIKPAPETPLDSYFLAQAVTNAGIPAGVVNIVTGGDATGAALVAHPGIDMVAFTGSSAVGRKIAAACGASLKRVTLELGGKSAGIVLEDADLDLFAATLGSCSVPYSGQSCRASNPHPRPGSALRRGRRHRRRRTRGDARRRSARPVHGDRPAGVCRSAEPGRGIHRTRQDRGSQAGAGRRTTQGPRPGLLRRAHRILRRPQRHAHRA